MCWPLGFCPWQFFFVVDVPFAGTDFTKFELRQVSVLGEMGEKDVVVGHMYQYIVRKAICQPFVRLYVKLNVPIQNYTNVIITGNPFQKIIEINKEKCIYMISYSDNKVANKWKSCTNIKKTIRQAIKRIFKLEVKILKHKLIYWKIGTHYFKPLSKEYKDRKEFLEIAQNPVENLFVVGEGLSTNQGWCEGAVESVNNIIQKIY